jgi:hypothetical protein
MLVSMMDEKIEAEIDLLNSGLLICWLNNGAVGSNFTWKQWMDILAQE